jgi:stage IV sporulation protein FB
MFLLEPGHTAFDLHFRVGGVSVRVHPLFWLLSAILGFSFLNAGFPPFLIWMACVFFSILVHELGHVAMFRACGAEAHVVLYAFGGLAIPDRRLHSRWQRIAVSFAGPFAQLLILVAVAVALSLAGRAGFQLVISLVFAMLGLPAHPPDIGEIHPLALEAIFILVEINLFWALLNLLPIFPLDGGQISRDFLEGVLPGGQGVRAALGISLVLAGLLAVHCIASANGAHFIPFLPSFGGMYSAMMFGMLAVQSFQMLQELSNPPWRREN